MRIDFCCDFSCDFLFWMSGFVTDPRANVVIKEIQRLSTLLHPSKVENRIETTKIARVIWSLRFPVKMLLNIRLLQ